MAKKKILITVKTYPSISTKYKELVCTAGFLEDGSWIRLYPIKYRDKAYEEQYKKWQWIEIDIIKNKSDFRPESYRPKSEDVQINTLGVIETGKKDHGAWTERRKRTIDKNTIYRNKQTLINDAKNPDKHVSLATFKPAKITNFHIEAVEREWNSKKIAAMMQGNLFEPTIDRKEVVRKLPYKFSYEFIDDKGVSSKLMIEDWEIGQLYWNCLRRHSGDESKACEDVRKKYMDDFAMTKDLYLFLGTTQAHHLTARNPFVIIGVFYPKHITQLGLFK